MSIRAILFDMDGVLVRTEEIWARILEDAGQRFRGSPVTREEFAPTFGQGTAADVKVFGLDVTTEELDRFYQQSFLDHAQDVWVDPDAAGVLERLHARGFRNAVVTNTVFGLAERLLRGARLLELIDAISCADMVARPKPAPDLVLHALEELGIGPGEAWFVGDSRFDREAALAAGTTFVGYRTDGDVRVDRLGDLEALLR